MRFAVLVCRLLGFLLEKLGRGSSFPGSVALKLCPDVLSKITLPGTVIAVTGSNGKTGTTGLIEQLARATGKRVVCNAFGSNQIEGVATVLLRSCDLNGRVRADIAVLESDERFCQYTFRHFSPTAIVVNNLFRDQLTRNGHNEFVAGELKKGLPADSLLILNADDPLVCTFAEGRRSVDYFGVSPDAFSEPDGHPHAYFDGAFCPVCKARMSYEWRVHNHLGGYHCEKCGYSRPQPTHTVTSVKDGGVFVLDGKYDIAPPMPNAMFAYNIAAAFTVGVEVLGLSPEKASETLCGLALRNDRVSAYDISGHRAVCLLSKHENSVSYDQNLVSALSSGSQELSFVFIVDLLSRKYIANDMSWLWDIDFELLRDERVKKIFVSGKFANDVALRLDFAGVPAEKLTVAADVDEMMDALYRTAAGDIYVLTCFTDMPKFKSRVRKGGVQ